MSKEFKRIKGMRLIPTSAPADPEKGDFYYDEVADSLMVYDEGWNPVGGGGDASEVTYTPDDDTDWSDIPTKVDGGLDELASRVTTLEADTGSGEKNYIANPSAATDLTGWTGGPELTLTRSTTPSELPREHTTGTGIKVVATSGTQTTASIVSYPLSLDDVDLNKKLKFNLAVKPVGSYASDDMEVYVAKQASPSVPLNQAVSIINADYVVEGTFDTDSVADLVLCIRCTKDMATGAGIVFSDTLVGPGSITQTTPSTPWETFTPTGSWTTNVTYTGRKKYVGDQAYYDVTVKLTGPNTQGWLYVDIPDEVDVDKLSNPSAGSYRVLDSMVHVYDHSAGGYTGLTAGATLDPTATRVAILYSRAGSGDITESTYIDSTNNIPIEFVADDSITVKFNVPVKNRPSVYLSPANNQVIAARVANSDTQELSPNADTVQVRFDTVNYNVGGGYSLGDDSFTVPVGGGGKYLITGFVDLTGDYQGSLTYALLVIRGPTFAGSGSLTQLDIQTNAVAGRRSIGGSEVVALSEGDKIYLGLYGEGDNSVNKLIATNATNFTVTRIADENGNPVVGFSMANENEAGLVSTQAQTLAGVKTFQDGALIKGVDNGTQAEGGYVGEFLSSNSAGVSLISVGTGNIAPLADILLPPGDWDVEGWASLSSGTASGISKGYAAVSLSPSAIDGGGNGGEASANVSDVDMAILPTGARRINLSSTTRVYLIASLNYMAAGDSQWNIYSRIQARRVR